MNFCPKCGSKIITKIIDDYPRFLCSENQCNFIYWNNPTPVILALVQYNQKYIIARNAKWPKEQFSLIAGFLEAGETVEEAALREVNEELGLQGSIYHFLGYHSFIEKNQLILAFEVKATGVIKTNHELAEIKLLSAQALLTYNFAPLYITKQVIHKWSKLHKLSLEATPA